MLWIARVRRAYSRVPAELAGLAVLRLLAARHGRATNSENLTASSILDLRTYLFDTQKDFWSDRYVLTTNYNYDLLQYTPKHSTTLLYADGRVHSDGRYPRGVSVSR